MEILLKKLRIQLPFDPLFLLLSIYLKNTETLIQKNMCSPIFIATLSTIAKIWPNAHMHTHIHTHMGFPGGSVVKNPPAKQETGVGSLGQKDPLEEGMATHPSILAWEILRREEPDRLQSIGSQQNWTQLSD